MKIYTTPRSEAAPTGGNFDPASPPALDNEKIANRSADARLQQETAKTSRSIAAALEAEAEAAGRTRRPQIQPDLTGRAAEVWDPIHSRLMTGYSRVRGRLDPPPVRGESVEEIIAAARAQGERKEPVDEILEPIAALESRFKAVDAAAKARRVLSAAVAADLTAAVRRERKALTAAVVQDLDDVIAEARRIAADLDGATTADEAITKGGGAVSAWRAKADVQEQMLTVVQSWFWVRRAVERGFTPNNLGEPDHFPPGLDHVVTPRVAWAEVEAMLADRGVTDVEVEILIGGN